MPTIALSREKLFTRIGRSFTDSEFDELCFAFGIELDDITSERLMAEKETGQTSSSNLKNLSEEIIYKIEIPANRCDLLSLEGLSRALRMYLGLEGIREWQLNSPSRVIHVAKPLSTVRPFVVGAILRNCNLGADGFESFIALQDKLHSNACRKRTLVSIGTHDLDKIAPGPIKCTALPPNTIEFVPLGQTNSWNASSLLQHYAEHDLYLKQFVGILRDSPVYPVFLDSTNHVLSLPPIINSEYSKLTAETKNIFIEICATDLTKAKLVLDVLCCGFAEYAQGKVEQVHVEYEDEAFSYASGAYPQWNLQEKRQIEVPLSYINSRVGINLKDTEELQNILSRMGLACVEKDQEKVVVAVPHDRSDILHLCDVMEDVAIGFGFNRIPKTLPSSLTIGSEQPISKLTDALRREMAFAGFTEILTLTLCSRKEAYSFLRRPEVKGEAVVLSNPATVEFEIVRPSLLPGTLKTVASNKSQPLPMKLFEVADVVLQDRDVSSEVGARNERHLICLFADSNYSGLELIRSTLNRLMMVLGLPRTTGVWTVEQSKCEDGAFFEGRRADIWLKTKKNGGGGDTCKEESSMNVDGFKIGTFGIVHPEVLEKYEIPFSCSALEINIEPFL